MIVIHVSLNTVPIDLPEVSMTHVQLIVGQQHTTVSSWTENAKAVKRNAE
jgi:hypothetical protein